ncbi:hypothetical protein [Candidatus Regiella insecticola]|uniref:hypothetical protein n=1 Tax=Candidatus Regiella insecticola TaxID=138073 RepID=UPI000906F25C|nr:hypothetical protein [Candidatus Regiella insecticola]
MAPLKSAYIPFAFQVAFGCQGGDRPMSVDILRDSANTRSQQRGGLKGEGYSYGGRRVHIRKGR